MHPHAPRAPDTARRLGWACVLVACLGANRVGEAVENITVDPASALRDTSSRPVGINANYLMDAERARTSPPPRTTQAALADIRPGYIRYPGGEKSDACLWSVSPWTASVPTLARTGPDEWPANDRQFTQTNNASWIQGREPLRFDEFMAICTNVGAQPTVCVCYDSAYKPAEPGNTSPSLGQLRTNAAEWVRYANVTKGYNVRYWEIGNETDYGTSYAGADPGATQYAADLAIFSAAMKAKDPTIWIGANGHSAGRFQTILQNTSAVAAIDFLAVHAYPTYRWTNGYEKYRASNPSFTGEVARALSAIDSYAAPADRARLRVALTEVNAVDWAADGWENVNDLGHALVAFDIIGQHLRVPRLLFAQLWNTRWALNDAVSLPVGTSNLLGAADNPGFEDGTNGWTIWSGTAQITTNEVHGGSRALACSGGAVVYVEHNVPPTRFAPGAVYTLGLWGRVTGTAAWSGAGIEFRQDGSRVDGWGPTVSGTSYGRYTQAFVCPAQFDEVVLWVYKTGSSDTLYVDDVVLSTGAAPSIYDALSSTNGLYATGRALAIWGQFLEDRLVAASGTSMVRAYASHDPAAGTLAVFLVNKDTAGRDAVVALANCTPGSTAQRWAFSGTGPSDLAPTWAQQADVTVLGSSISVTLAPVSITVLTLIAPLTDPPPAPPHGIAVQPAS